MDLGHYMIYTLCFRLDTPQLPILKDGEIMLMLTFFLFLYFQFVSISILNHSVASKLLCNTFWATLRVISATCDTDGFFLINKTTSSSCNIAIAFAMMVSLQIKMLIEPDIDNYHMVI